LAGLLSERAQKVYLVLSGLIVFFLSAQLLSLKSEPVPFELKVYHWPLRLEQAPFPVRVLGKDLLKGRLSPTRYCGDLDQLVGSYEGSPATPLDLSLPDNQAAVSLCVETSVGRKENLELAPPPAHSRAELGTAWTLEMGQTQSHPSGYNNFPLGFLILPESGSFNPRNPSAFFRLWLSKAPKTLLWIDKEKKEHIVEVDSEGLYQIPLRQLLLQGKARVVAENEEGMRYPMDVTFQGISRDVALEAKLDSDNIHLEVQALGVPGQKRTEPTVVYCSLFVGNAQLQSFTVEVSPSQDKVVVDLTSPGSDALPLGLQCDSTPYGTANDSAWTWVLPNLGAPGYEELQNLARGSLEPMIGQELSSRILSWGASKDPADQRRFLRIFSNLLIPRAPKAIIQWTSLPGEMQKRRTRYESQRFRLVVVVVFLFFSWLFACVASLRQLKKRRIESLYELSLEGSLDELPDTPEGEDPLARPRSHLLSMVVLGVTILGMAGLLWVLISF
jgi:hypothetical protein